jgi:hypothetical protein
MINAYYPASVGIGSTANVKIKSVEDYTNKGDNNSDTTLTKFYYAAKNPGTWANKLTVYAIDGAADQTISGISTTTTTTTVFTASVSNLSGSVIGSATSITGITTSGISLGMVVQCDVSNIVSAGTTVTGIGSSVITLSQSLSSNFSTLNTEFDFGSLTQSTVGIALSVGIGVSITLNNREYAGVGNTSTFNGYLKGIVTGIGQSSVDVKLISKHSTDDNTAEYIDYSPTNPLYSIVDGDVITFTNSSSVGIATITSGYTLSDWYNNQTVILGGSTVYWKNIAERPSTSQFTQSNGGKNDEYNLIVVDTEGKINGNAGEILERFSKLSKAKDGKITPAQSTYYVDYIRDNSSYLFAGTVPTELVKTRFSSINSYSTYSGGTWGIQALNNFFDVIGNKTYQLDYGSDYSTTANDYKVSLNDAIESYSIFENPAEYPVNFIITGPSDGDSVFEAQAKANYIISLAESRKDCIVVVSPYENEVVNTTNSTTQTNNIIKFFSGITASNYAVFDSGYKYTFDRFNNKFLYLACNSDIAGLMARTSINQFPWISPAGAARGIINNAIKLAYNPSEAQRDLLYSNKINPVIASPGQGIMLYGDKTASAYVSAFDRINVRRLFLTIERTIENAARSQLFEFNDAITRTNFVNIVEPYLRDVRAKRGITEFLVICDESNNTPDIIDSNQFRADIFVKPNRSINFIGLTFVATRTGISFSEIVGSV